MGEGEREGKQGGDMKHSKKIKQMLELMSYICQYNFQVTLINEKENRIQGRCCSKEAPWHMQGALLLQSIQELQIDSTLDRGYQGFIHRSSKLPTFSITTPPPGVLSSM